ncbi:hypothetical protein [Haliscomenobacter sp.]|uniref:hypothetical protein n=1 Tax=Haliscomenobacter sp. TaxID=2717303 RepID=UPI003593725A
MSETPKAKSWSVLFFLLLISLILLPKAGVDFIQSNIRIQVEKTRQENLQALTPLMKGSPNKIAKLTKEINQSQSLLSTLKEIKKLSTFQLIFYSLVLIGLIWSRQAKRVENSVELQNV